MMPQSTMDIHPQDEPYDLDVSTPGDVEESLVDCAITSRREVLTIHFICNSKFI